MGKGYGLLPNGRSNYGNAESRYEPRFEDSDPVDGSTLVPSYRDVVYFTLYCFSSQLDFDTLLLEISEDGGASYVDAYKDGAFLEPYNSTYSKVMAYCGQRVKFFIDKNWNWAGQQEIRVRVTVKDGFGNVTTKEPPVEW